MAEQPCQLVGQLIPLVLELERYPFEENPDEVWAIAVLTPCLLRPVIGYLALVGSHPFS